jgi:translocation and assembly module TamB
MTRMLLRVLRDTVGLLVTLTVGALVFLLFTEAGAQLSLRELESRLGQIRVENASGRLWGPLHAQRLVYEDDFVFVELDSLSLDWSLLQALRGRVAVSTLDAARVGVIVKDRESAPDESADQDALTRLPFDLAIGELRIGHLEVLGVGTEPLAFERIVLSALWRGDEIELDTLQVDTPWVGAMTLSGAAQLQPDAIEIRQLRVAGFVDAQIDGRWGYAGASELTVDWSALHWPPGGEDVQFASDGGIVHWRGIPDDWQFDLDATMQLAGESLRVDTEGRGSLAEVSLERASIDTGHGRAQLTADLQFDGMVLDVRGRVEALDPQHWVPQIEGRVQGDFTAAARLGDAVPSVRFELALDDVRLQGHVGQLDTAGTWRGDALKVDRFDARVGRNRAQLSGQVLPELALQARIDAPELAVLLPALSGSVRAQLRAAGPLQRPRLSGNIDAEKLYYEAFGGELASIRFDLDPAQRLVLDASLRELSVGTPVDRAEIDLRGTLADHRLLIDAQMPSAQLRAAFEGALNPELRRWSGQFAEARIAVEAFPALELESPARLQVAQDQIELEPACLAADGARLCAGLRPVDQGRRIAFRLQNLQLAMLEPWLAGLQADGAIEGRGYVDVAAAGLDDVRLDFKSSRMRLTRAGLPPLTVLPGYLRIVEDAKALDLSASLPLARGGLRLSGRLAPGSDFMQRAFEGEMSVEVPELSWLHVLNFELQEAKGQLSGRIRADGTLAVPRFDGRVDLRETSLRLRTPGIRLEQVEASLSGSSEGVLRIAGAAKSDGGQLRVDGQLDSWRQPLRVDLKVTGDDFLAVRTPDASVRISPDLTVALADGALRVDGSVDVPRAEITPKRISGGIGPSADQVIIRRGDDAGGEALGTYANVRLRLGDAVRFDGFGLRTRLTGAVRLIEAPGVPTRARGELQLVGGRYEAYGQELSLETGKLLFTGGALTQPAVEIRATREPREDITVGVLVRGTLDKPKFSLFSTPAMPQEQQLSWLVLGRSLDQTGSSSDRGLVADAALGLGLAGGEWLAQRFGSRIGFDEVTLGAKPGESTEQAQITVGKYLSPKLFIAYGVSLFQPGQSFRLQYDIGNGFKLATETGVESGGDLLYTIER